MKTVCFIWLIATWPPFPSPPAAPEVRVFRVRSTERAAAQSLPILPSEISATTREEWWKHWCAWRSRYRRVLPATSKAQGGCFGWRSEGVQICPSLQRFPKLHAHLHAPVHLAHAANSQSRGTCLSACLSPFFHTLCCRSALPHTTVCGSAL